MYGHPVDYAMASYRCKTDTYLYIILNSFKLITFQSYFLVNIPFRTFVFLIKVRQVKAVIFSNFILISISIFIIYFEYAFSYFCVPHIS